MQERIEHRGEWWVPGSDDRWPGTFIYEPETGIEVAVTAPSDSIEFPTQEPYPMLHGKTVDGKAITLSDVFASSTRLHLPGGVDARLKPSQAFLGRMWFDPGERIRFDRLVLQLEGLAEWGGMSGFKWNHQDAERFTLEYEVPESVEIAAINKLSVRLSFSASSKPRGMPMSGINVSQKAHLELIADEPTPFADLDEIVRQIRNFFMFVTRDRVPLISLDGELEVDVKDKRQRKQRLRILDRREVGTEARASDPDPLKMLFTMGEGGTNRDSRLTQWLQLKEELGPIFDLYLVALYQPRTFLELQFLSLSQAAESLHSRRFDGKALPTEEHRDRVQRVVHAAPEELQDWAKGKLEPANRKSFRDGLMELLDRLPPNTRDLIPEPSVLAEKVRVTRNYLTHWNEDLKQDAAQDDELIAVTRVLRVILEALILIEIGFSVDQADELLKRNPSHQQELRHSTDMLRDSLA